LSGAGRSNQIFRNRGFVPAQPEAVAARGDRVVDDLDRFGQDRAPGL
jgi:hypothetical protein